MTSKKANPWSRKSQTTKPSGDGLSPTPSAMPRKKTGSLAGLKKKGSASSVPTKPTQPSGVLAKPTSAKPSSPTTSPTPSTKATSRRTSSAGTRLRRPMDQASPSSTQTKPPSSTASTGKATSAGSARATTTRQPFGGSSLHEASYAANLKRAKRLATSFPPGKKVRIAWDRDPAYAVGPGDFSGVIDNYDEKGYLTAINGDGVRLWIPCGMVRIKAAA